MFLDEMGLHSCSNRRRVSVTLDAGYIVYRPTTTGGLQGTKLICVIMIIGSLFLISLINLTVRPTNRSKEIFMKIFQCLIWFMHQLDWSLFDSYGSRTFQIDRVNQQVRFSKQVRSTDPIYTKEIIDHDRMDLSANKQVRNLSLYN